MQVRGNQFLPCSGFSGYQHRGILARNFLNPLSEIAHGLGFSDKYLLSQQTFNGLF